LSPVTAAKGPERIVVADWMRTQIINEIGRKFAEAGIPASAVRSYSDAAHNPHVLERDML
jgi:crotonobetainyl-CoA:carnitine CoA-transferase CaiB-like acyl-CoA transferase